MSLSELSQIGDLPVGIHAVTLAQVLERFGVGNARRVALAQRLERIYALATSTGHVAHFIVFGSFITSKEDPNDVDVFLLMEDSFDVAAVGDQARLLFDHPAAQAVYGASVFWLRKLAVIGDERSAVEDWQIKRDGSRRGIIEITGR